MNILFLLRLYPVYGGGETVTLCLANEMVKRGWNVSILYFKENIKNQLPYIDPRINAVKIENVNYGEFSTDKASELKSEQEKVHKFTVRFINEHDIQIVMNQWWPLCFIKRLKAETKAKIIKVNHTTLYAPIFDGTGLKAVLRRKFKKIYEIHKKRISLKVVTDTLPYVDRYVFLSPAFQKQYEDMAHYKNTGKLNAIPNPLVFDSFINAEKYAKKENIVLIVARMSEASKRITRALQAWSLVEKDPISTDWKLQIVGDGPDLSAYKQMAIDLNIQRVKFEGYQHPLAYYEKAKIFLMTSAIEGFGMTLIESQQQGVVPIVMDTFLALHDIITSEENGIITPDNDIKSFAEAILSLIQNPQRLDKLAKTGINSSKKFAIGTIVDKWEKLYLELLSH